MRATCAGMEVWFFGNVTLMYSCLPPTGYLLRLSRPNCRVWDGTQLVGILNVMGIPVSELVLTVHFPSGPTVQITPGYASSGYWYLVIQPAPTWRAVRMNPSLVTVK